MGIVATEPLIPKLAGLHPVRIRTLNDAPVREGRYVLYWMQQSQRTRFNHALEYAIMQANARGLPVATLFGLTADYPEANARHFAFMLEGLRDVAHAGSGCSAGRGRMMRSARRAATTPVAPAIRKASK